MSNDFCPQCHAPVGPDQWICGACGTNLPIPGAQPASDAAASEPAAPPPAAPFAPPTLAPPVVGAAFPPLLGSEPVAGAVPTGPPPLIAPPPAMPGTPTGSSTVVPSGDRPAAGGKNKKWLLPAIVVLALLGGVGAWFAFRGDDEPKAVVPTVPELPTTVSVVLSTVPVPATTVPASTVPETTEAPTTTVAATTTVAPTTTAAPSTTAAPPAWVPPVPPNPPVFTGPGAPYAVSEPLASGMPGATAQPSLLFAQGVFDQLAANDWFNALSRFLFRAPGEVETPLTPDQLQSEWQVSDRLSLLLIDATPDPNGVAYDLRVGVLANIENGTTSVACGHLYVEIAPNPKVIQLGTFPLVSQGEPQMQPEDFLNQPARIADLVAKCP